MSVKDMYIILELDHSSYRLKCIHTIHAHTHTHLGVVYLIKATSFISADDTRMEMLLNDKHANE